MIKINQIYNNINISFNIKENEELINKIKEIKLDIIITKIYNMIYYIIKNRKININKKNNYINIIFKDNKEEKIKLNVKKSLKNIYNISFKENINIDNINEFIVFINLDKNININDNDKDIKQLDYIFNKINDFENTLNKLFVLDIEDILQFINNYELYIYCFDEFLKNYAKHHYFKTFKKDKDINDLDMSLYIEFEKIKNIDKLELE